MDDNLNDIAQTILAKMPEAKVAFTQTAALLTQGGITHLAVPDSFNLVALDDEPLLTNPRRIKASAIFADELSFIQYVNANKAPESLLWVIFNPQTYELAFKAVFDEHGPSSMAGPTRPGWRAHTASFTPLLSHEWKVWKGGNGQAKDQVPFAEFIEQNGMDIYGGEGWPDTLSMLRVATEFVAKSDMSVKSIARLQSGGVRLEYINDPVTGGVDVLAVPEKFMIAIPVFWGVKNADGSVPAYRLEARLKYQLRSAAVKFTYELVRPDKKHEQAALELIQRVRDGVGAMPVLLGSMS